MSGLSICKSLWLAFFAIWALWAVGAKRTQTRETFRSRIPYLIFTVGAFYVMFSQNVTLRWMEMRILPRYPEIANMGIGITAAGLLLAVWARAYLGGNWSGAVTVKVGHQLIRTGPYRWVRHPIYSGMILALIGTAINLGQLRGFIAGVLLWIGFTMKCRIEERYMMATFGAKYEEYRQTTGRIVPRFGS
jgi:protein-S-isoprenylcysteine O-methyltransferase Ste14